MGWLTDNSRVLQNVSNNVALNLVANYGLILGCIGGVCLYGSFPLFYYKFGQSATEFQKSVAIAFLPWSCKAFVGAVSDTVPILGWHKRWYMIFANLVLSGALVGVGFSKTIDDALGFLVLTSTAVMITNTLWEGQYANMVSFMRADPRGIAFSWGMYMAGLGLGACIVGPLGDKTGDSIHLAFFIVAPLPIIPILPLLFIPDSTLPGDETSAATAPTLLSPEGEVEDDLRANKPSSAEWSIVSWITASSILLILVLMHSKFDAPVVALYLCIVIVGVSIASIVLVYRHNRLFVVVCVYSLCHQLFWVNIQGALDSYYTAGPLCLYDGPNFDLVFYYSIVQIVSSIVGLCAAGLHAGVFSEWDVRSAEINAIVFRIVTGLFDLCIVQRWNKRCAAPVLALRHLAQLLLAHLSDVGVPVLELTERDFSHDLCVFHRRYLHVGDKPFYIMGDAIAGEAATILVMLPLKTLASRLMPRGKATTSYALLDSFQFLGVSVSRIVGIVMTKSLGVRASSTTGCDFTQLPVLIALAHMVLPILSLSLAWAIVPRVITKHE